MRLSWGRVAIGVLVLVAGTRAAEAQVVVKVNDNVFFRFGLQLQGTLDWQQDPIGEGYSQNMFLRRIRFAVAGQVTKDVSFFFQTDAPRLGNAGAGTTTPTKNLATGFIVQDAFGEWRIAGDAVMLDAGLFYVPQSRNVLTSTSSNLTIDSGNFLQQQNTLTQSSTGRDAGFQLKGYLGDDHLEYRAAVFDGLRVPSTPAGAGSRNAYRFAGRVQWDFLDTEKGYVYVGVQRGARKIVELGAWADAQGDYLGWGADAALDLPVGKFGSVNAEVDYCAFDGGTEFTSVVGGVVTPLLPKQDSITAQAGFWFAPVNLQPFVRYEMLNLSDPVFAAREQKRFVGGMNWYIVGNNLKLSGLYERIDPKAAVAGSKIKNTDHYLVQIQFYYF
jgi:hypothetical protein